MDFGNAFRRNYKYWLVIGVLCISFVITVVVVQIKLKNKFNPSENNLSELKGIKLNLKNINSEIEKNFTTDDSDTNRFSNNDNIRKENTKYSRQSKHRIIQDENNGTDIKNNEKKENKFNQSNHKEKVNDLEDQIIAKTKHHCSQSNDSVEVSIKRHNSDLNINFNKKKKKNVSFNPEIIIMGGNSNILDDHYQQNNDGLSIKKLENHADFESGKIIENKKKKKGCRTHLINKKRKNPVSIEIENDLIDPNGDFSIEYQQKMNEPLNEINNNDKNNKIVHNNNASKNSNVFMTKVPTAKNSKCLVTKHQNTVCSNSFKNLPNLESISNENIKFEVKNTEQNASLKKSMIDVRSLIVFLIVLYYSFCILCVFSNS